MMKITTLSICLISLYIPSFGAHPKSNKKVELLASIAIKATSAPPSMTTIASQPGHYGYRIEETLTKGRKPVITYTQKEPFFKSEAGKNKAIHHLRPLAKIPTVYDTLLQRSMRIAQQKCTKEHDEAWSRWQYYSDGSLKFVKVTLLNDLLPPHLRKLTQKTKITHNYDTDSDMSCDEETE